MEYCERKPDRMVSTEFCCTVEAVILCAYYAVKIAVPTNIQLTSLGRVINAIAHTFHVQQIVPLVFVCNMSPLIEHVAAWQTICKVATNTAAARSSIFQVLERGCSPQHISD